MRQEKLVLLLMLGLVSCRDHAASPRDGPGASRPAIQAPVNPDIAVVTYACVDGQSIVAGYPDRETAVVTYMGHAYTLKLAPSASGARYTGYGMQWWIQGPHASIAALKPGEEIASAPGLDCASEQTSSGASSITRTSFSAQMVRAR